MRICVNLVGFLGDFELAELLRRWGDIPAARDAYVQALARGDNPRERRLLERKLREL